MATVSMVAPAASILGGRRMDGRGGNGLAPAVSRTESQSGVMSIVLRKYENGVKNMKHLSCFLMAAAVLGAFPTGASAHYRHCHRMAAGQPAYYPQPQRQWNPIGAIMAVPRAALEVPRAALAVPGRIIGGDDE